MVLVSEKKKTSKLADIFEGAGFQRIPSDGIHVTVCGQTGEIDYIFVWENLIVLCEETDGKDVSHHYPKKEIFHGIIKDNPAAFLNEYCNENEFFKVFFGKSGYERSDIEIRCIYYSSTKDIEPNRENESLKIINKKEINYFHSVVKSIQISGKYEILKYLNVKLKDIGENRLTGNDVNIKSFPGFVVPPNHTHYPDGFLVVSFYADPQSLIRRSSVLRRDGWLEPELSYQRFVDDKKIKKMRENLSKHKKVYVNNLIVTLSNSTLKYKDKTGVNKIIGYESINKTTAVTVEIPEELGVVGVIDGQHRMFSYFEGNSNDKNMKKIDEEIQRLGKRQNLLVTGIIFPEKYQGRKEAFEAELFLSINNNQKGVDTILRQDLERIINPNSSLALARSIISRLSSEGALSGKLRMSQADPAGLIATGSLAPYVARSIVGKTSSISKEWSKKRGKERRDENNDDYIEYVVAELRDLLGAAAKILAHKWKPASQKGVLSTTVVGGFLIVCDYFVGRYKKDDRDYNSILKKCKIGDINFSKYTGSQWTKLARDIYKNLEE